MEQRRREQEHHEKQELQQLKHKEKSQQSKTTHTHTKKNNYHRKTSPTCDSKLHCKYHACFYQPYFLDNPPNPPKITDKLLVHYYDLVHQDIILFPQKTYKHMYKLPPPWSSRGSVVSCWSSKWLKCWPPVYTCWESDSILGLFPHVILTPSVSITCPIFFIRTWKRETISLKRRKPENLSTNADL